MTNESYQALLDRVEGVAQAALDKALAQLDHLRPEDFSAETATRTLASIQTLLNTLTPETWWAGRLIVSAEPTDQRDSVGADAPDGTPEYQVDMDAVEPKPVKTDAEPPKDEAPVYDMEAVKNILLRLGREFPDDKDMVRDLLASFGAHKLSELPPERYGELVAKAQAKAGIS